MEKEQKAAWPTNFAKRDGPIRAAHWALIGCSGTSPLSFHCRERVVFAALSNQPHALPTTLGTVRPRLTSESHGPLSAWNGRVSIKPPTTVPVGQPQCPISLLPPLGSQAHATELGDRLT
ncbi:hypothetical protein M9H77_14870 [Catharanthus roseus]|uniref:Uncharacterized protein n=1 Tax=Catharanthus roseus TaxID=4058 RepID=A0ACC0BPA2_CATRO|nr:hypothetical protein M9H77_14870 [Catharanthus roseus]